MSSIRDALKRAEQQRLKRLGSDSEVPQSSEPAHEAPDEAAPSTEPATSDLHVVGSAPLPLIEVPIEFTQEIALFRQAVETALPQPRRSLVMTSATDSEGTTLISTFLAINLAIRDSKRTCLIDGNFQSPKLSRLFGILGKPGFSDYCTGRAELGDVIQRTESPDLFVLGLGTDVYNPSLILSNERARGLASELGQRFDYVIYDTGAVLGNAETSMLVPTVDGVVLVVRANKTKREVLAKAEKLIRFSGGTVIGTVLNRRTFPIPDTIYKRL